MGSSDLSRRAFVAAAAGLSAGALVTPRAFAQGNYPAQPIRIIVPFGPGGLADISTRLVAQKLNDKLGQQVIVDNRPGAGGVVAANAALAAPHDGYTLILFSNGTAISKTLLKLNYDAETDFVPVSTMALFDLVLLAPKGKFKDLRAVLAEGRKRQLTLGAINPGSTQNLSAELFKSVAKLNAQVVPFKTSGDVMAAIVRGDVDVGFESYAALRGPIDSGQVEALAVTGPKRAAWLPHVPTTEEAGLPGYEVVGWNAIYAAKGVPAAAIDLLSRTVRDVVALPDVHKRMLELGIEPHGSTPAEQAALFDHDRRKWAKVIHDANIKLQ